MPRERLTKGILSLLRGTDPGGPLYQQTNAHRVFCAAVSHSRNDFHRAGGKSDSRSSFVCLFGTRTDNTVFIRSSSYKGRVGARAPQCLIEKILFENHRYLKIFEGRSLHSEIEAPIPPPFQIKDKPESFGVRVPSSLFLMVRLSVNWTDERGSLTRNSASCYEAHAA